MPNLSNNTKRKQYKRIKSRKGASSQSKQILTLAKRVNKLTEMLYEQFMMRWNRQLSGAEGFPSTFVPNIPFCTVVPVPITCATNTYDLIYGASWCSNEYVGNPAIDPTTPANGVVYTKENIFGRAKNSWQTSQIHHRGGTLKYRLVSGTFNEQREYLLALVSLKNADQITTSRFMKKQFTAQPPAGGGLPPLPTLGSEGSQTTTDSAFDYTFASGQNTTTDTQFMLNPKIYKIHSARRITLGTRPLTGGTATTVNTNSNSGNSNLVATGSFRIPSAGKIVASAQRNTTGANAQLNSGQDLPFALEKNEKTKYLILLGTVRSTQANDPVKLSVSVVEKYLASGGSV